MTKSRTLPKAGLEPAAVIVQETTEPVVYDHQTDGEDLRCRCGQLLAQAIWQDQLWNLVIRCISCGETSACDPLPPGTPLPALVISLAYGEHSVPEPLDLQGQVIVGVAAYEQRVAEIGEPGSTFFPRQTTLPESLTREHLRELINKAKALLGHHFDAVAAASNRQSRKSRPSRATRHGLIHAIQLLQASEKSFDTSAPFVDAGAWSELRALVSLTDRWRGHPDFEVLRKGFIHEYEHTLTLLATATFLEDSKTGVQLQATQVGERSADLRIGTGPRQEGYVEIKAPLPLNRPTSPLTRELAEGVVSKAVHKAKTGRKGQLKRGFPALLVVGGYQLSEVDLNLLERAADSYLARAAHLNIHRSLMGIVFINIGTRVQRRFSATGEPTNYLNRQFVVRVSKHPGYTGAAELVTTPRI